MAAVADRLSRKPPTDVRLRFELYDVQRAFVTDQHKYSAFIAGRGAGKSHSGCVRDLVYMLSHPGCMGVIGAPTYPMLRDTTRRTFLELCPPALITRYNQQENVVELYNGSTVLFRSCDEPDRLRGPNLAFIHLDEAGYIAQDAWRILKATLRQPGFPQQAWLTSTPKGRNWIFEEWVSNPTPHHALYKAQTTDNPALPDDFAESLGYAGQFYEQEILGEFVGFEGLVYPGFYRERHVCPVMDAPYRRVVCGVDWGFRDPAVLLVIADYGDHRYHIVEEWYARGVTIDEQIAAAKDLRDRWHIERFLADPSRPDSILLMQRAGLPVSPAENDILTGISTVTTLLAERGDGQHGLLVAPSCVQTIAELESYQWPDAKPQRNAGEKPLDFNNHCLDAARYATYWLEHPQESGILIVAPRVSKPASQRRSRRAQALEIDPFAVLRR